ncbi:MAG: carbon-nitrogen hydrolase family protein [Planctomycetales bacterium]|nr:carbon-nitrogen hydrolase family protein [Planctomycetales bacterium]
MQRSLCVAACQMNSGLDKEANFAVAERLIRQAAGQGAQLVALPELFNCLGPLPEIIAQAEPIPGPSSRRLSALAAELQVALCAGSICEQAAVDGKGHNTTLTFGPDGTLLSRYRKMHLFDVVMPGGPAITESDFMIAGDEVVCTNLDDVRLGHATCYDLRFPELFRALSAQGVDALVIPAAFTFVTGRDHWEVLLRARAIENQAFVVAPNQFGGHGAGLRSWGRSLIIDPWGEILAQADGESETALVAELSPARLASVRAKLPALSHRRL